MKVIYEDDSILVVSKPAGQTVNRAETTRGERTLQDELEEYLQIRSTKHEAQNVSDFDAQISDFTRRAGIVHRLDKETSGVLVVAKTEKAFAELQRQFKAREVKKEYLALVHGEIKDRRGRIEAPIGRNPKNRMRFDVVEGGRPSATEYETIDNQPSSINNEAFSYLRVRPLTGRTHQIRVHMKHIGHPVVADPLYLSHKQLKQDRQWCPRIFLHAESLGFAHPVSGAWVRFEAELPEDLKAALKRLTFSC